MDGQEAPEEEGLLERWEGEVGEGGEPVLSAAPRVIEV